MSNEILNIIEPTLFDQTGHGFSYVQSLLRANKDFTIHVWIDKRSSNLFPKELCTSHKYFVRALRQIQKVFLYFRLIPKPEIIFVSTSDMWDLKLLAFWSKLFFAKARVFLHFHQFKQSSTKLEYIRKIATTYKNITILTPTEKLAQIFTDQGFSQCQVIPCPSFAPLRTVELTTPHFSKILYAGAARSDKGFPLVVRLLQHLRLANVATPFEIQISAPNSQRYDQASAEAIQLLNSITKQNLILYRDTLDQRRYLSLFNNAICLLLYDQSSYQDKFSGIALDAFYAGCPIITVKNTWMGDTAQKYAAGIALDNLQLPAIQQAIEEIIRNYEAYHVNAKKAAIELQQLHDPKNTLEALLIT